MDGSFLARAFEHNAGLIETQTAGVSHDQSVGTGGHGINSLNWIVGHVVQSRDRLLIEMGAEPIMGDAMFGRYGMGSDPIGSDGPDVVPLGDLLGLVRLQSGRVQDSIGRLTEEELGATVLRGDTSVELGYRILRYLMHDSFHAGQTDVLGRISEES